MLYFKGQEDDEEEFCEASGFGKMKEPLWSFAIKKLEDIASYNVREMRDDIASHSLSEIRDYVLWVKENLELLKALQADNRRRFEADEGLQGCINQAMNVAFRLEDLLDDHM